MNDKVARAFARKDRKGRFQMVWTLAKGKTVCEGGDSNDDGMVSD